VTSCAQLINQRSTDTMEGHQRIPNLLPAHCRQPWGNPSYFCRDSSTTAHCRQPWGMLSNYETHLIFAETAQPLPIAASLGACFQTMKPILFLQRQLNHCRDVFRMRRVREGGLRVIHDGHSSVRAWASHVKFKHLVWGGHLLQASSRQP